MIAESRRSISNRMKNKMFLLFAKLFCSHCKQGHFFPHYLHSKHKTINCVNAVELESETSQTERSRLGWFYSSG